MKINIKLLKNIATIIAGQSPPSTTYNSVGSGLPFFQGKTDFGDKFPTAKIWCTGKKVKEAIQNDILMSVRAPVGPVNICNEHSIIGRGLAAIRPQKGNSHEYLYYFLKNSENKIASLGTGSTFKAITKDRINAIKVPMPHNYDDQIRIATILTRAENLIVKRKKSIELLDELLKSTFLEMFGDPVNNEMGWEKAPLSSFGDTSTGNTPSRQKSEYYDSKYIEWIKTANIEEDNIYITKATEYLSEEGEKYSRTLDENAILVACIAGSLKSIGRVALTDRKVSFNQQINAIQPNKEMNPLFLYILFKICRKYIQSKATKGMKKIIIKSVFDKIVMIKPPVEYQNKFAQIVKKIESIKSKYKQSLTELENLYGALSQRAFKGELDLNKIPVKKEPEPIIGTMELTIPSLKMEGELIVQKPFSKQELLSIIKNKNGSTFNFNELWDDLEKADFKKMPAYDEIKEMVFMMLEDKEPILSQSFDEDRKEIVLKGI